MTFLDSNIVLRYFLWDDAKQAQRAQRLFAAIEAGREQVFTTAVVVAEVEVAVVKVAKPVVLKVPVVLMLVPIVVAAKTRLTAIIIAPITTTETLVVEIRNFFI